MGAQESTRWGNYTRDGRAAKDFGNLSPETPYLASLHTFPLLPEKVEAYKSIRSVRTGGCRVIYGQHTMR